MGYWDKKEPKKLEQEEVKKPVQTKEIIKEEYDNIDIAALDQFEKEANEKAQGIAEEVAGIAEDIARQKRTYADLLSSNYWCAIVFNNDLQKQQFLNALGFDPSWTFIKGKEFCRSIGVTLEEPDHDYNKERRLSKAYKYRARPVKEQK